MAENIKIIRQQMAFEPSSFLCPGAACNNFRDLSLPVFLPHSHNSIHRFPEGFLILKPDVASYNLKHNIVDEASIAKEFPEFILGYIAEFSAVIDGYAVISD